MQENSHAGEAGFGLDLMEEEAALGEWPRCLLHVNSNFDSASVSLTSYEWQPGNIYGSFVAPKYNAITYTWGRWRLPDDDQRRVDVLPVKGLQWDVPRIDPSQFTAQQFLEIVKKATTAQPKSVFRKSNTPSTVEFVWLDIACIDQRANEPKAAAEIGRQAMIFRGAQTVYAWLNTFERQQLESMITQIDRAVEYLEEFTMRPGFRQPSLSTTFDTASPNILYQNLQQLLDDPWFSSLWTLQEAFLRQDAYILSKNAELIHLPDPTVEEHVAIEDLLGYCWTLEIKKEEIGKAFERPISENGKSILSKLSNLVEKRGLVQLGTPNPIAVYSAAGNRTATCDADYIYAIQQIFNFRLGNSVASGSSKSVYSRAELEDQLGAALLDAFPTLSQFHVFTKPVELGKGWRMNPYSKIPEIGGKGGILWSPSPEASQLCKFSTRVIDNNVWGHFEGKCCSFKTLSESLSRFDEQWISKFWPNRAGQGTTLRIYPDATRYLDLPVPLYYQHDNLNGDTQRMYSRWLIENVQEDRLFVLLLGSYDFLTTGGMLGMILLLPDFFFPTYWNRVGVCSWDTSDATMGGVECEEYALLEGTSSEWIFTTGIFG